MHLHILNKFVSMSTEMTLKHIFDNLYLWLKLNMKTKKKMYDLDKKDLNISYEIDTNYLDNITFHINVEKFVLQ